MTQAQYLNDAAVTLLLADAFRKEPAARRHFLECAVRDVEAAQRLADAEAVEEFLFAA